MLINFSVTNWMSYRDKVRLTMIATREQQHGDRLFNPDKYPFRVLPSAVIYGGNASGKSNLFKAINFARHFITQPTRPDLPIGIEPFKLDPVASGEPVSFEFEILIEDHLYRLSFSLSGTEVLEEKLERISANSERILYHRVSGSSKPGLHSSLKKDYQRLWFAFLGTQKNQLYLANCKYQGLKNFEKVFDWFAQTLLIVTQDSRFEEFHPYPYLDDTDERYKVISGILDNLDTGITQLRWENLPLNTPLIPEELKQQVNKSVGDGQYVRISPRSDSELVILAYRQNGEFGFRKLCTQHGDVRFEMREESDGTKRTIALLPALMALVYSETPKVCLIDEICLSLHPNLLRELVKLVLFRTGGSKRSQLLLSTHNHILMDQALFRRDEIWVTERDQRGHSRLMNFSEYGDIRSDKNIVRSYLQGRMGGVPDILPYWSWPGQVPQDGEEE